MLPPELIVDASILFSFFNKSSARREVLKELLNIGCTLISPKFVLEELFNNKSKIMHFAKISESEFNEIFLELNNDLEILSEETYREFLSQASKISPHKSPKDDPYFALALSSKFPIWSDETAFKEQSSIEIFTTNQLDKLLNKLISEE